MNLQTSRVRDRKNNEKFVKDIFEKLEEHASSNAFVPSTFDKKKVLKRFKEVNKCGLEKLSFSTSCLKDLISNTDSYVSGGSKFLEHYIPPFNATVYLDLKKNGVINFVNSNLDEFGLGGTGLHSHIGIVPNPIDNSKLAGGSSSGGGYLISKGALDFSIVSDTGDSARYPSSCCGIFGFKPSYGAISRYGFYPFCSGFDTPAIMANSLEQIAEIFSVISHADKNDLCTLKTESKDYLECLNKELDPRIKIAVIKDTFWRSASETEEFKLIETKFQELTSQIQKELKLSVEVYEFPQNLLRLCEALYKVIAYSESISNYSNLTGLLFPFETNKDGTVNILKKDNGKNFSEVLKNNRALFGSEFVIRQLLGMHFLEGQNYEDIYLKSKKILTLINKEVDLLFKNFDLIISPTSDSTPSSISDHKRTYSPSNIKNLLILANFCSLPAISMPWINIDNLPVGIHLMSSFRSDGFLLNVAKYISELINKNN